MIKEVKNNSSNLVNLRNQEEGRSSYGFRKCSKSQARRIDAERSGRPLWGLHGWLSIPPASWNDFCCRRHWSSSFSLGVSPFVVPGATGSFSPIAFFVITIWLTTPSLRQRKCLDMAFDASLEYTAAEPCPATASNDDTTARIWSQYLLYLLSTW